MVTLWNFDVNFLQLLMPVLFKGGSSDQGALEEVLRSPENGGSEFINCVSVWGRGGGLEGVESYNLAAMAGRFYLIGSGLGR